MSANVSTVERGTLIATIVFLVACCWLLALRSARDCPPPEVTEIRHTCADAVVGPPEPFVCPCDPACGANGENCLCICNNTFFDAHPHAESLQ